jgi:zeaxanthin glucosyltransferase
MKIGFISLPVPGHLNPMTALARELQSRNRDVVLISLPDTEPFVRNVARLPFIPCCEKEFPAGSTPAVVRQMSRLQGQEAAQFVVRICAAITSALLKSLPRLINSAGIDALVLDTYQFYLELVPIKLGIPYVHVSNALHFDYSGHTPLCIFDWPHETTPAAVARNRAGVAGFMELLKQASPAAGDYAERAGIKMDWENYTTISKLAWITQTPKEFDFASSHWPSQLHHTGPFLDSGGRENVEFPWERLTGEPLIYASMGTLQNGLPHVFRAIATAAANYQDMQLVLSIGNNLDPQQIGSLPNNAVVVKSAPQLELLKRASVCITHAGFNTVIESLANGVPQVAIPITHDQPGVAARIADKKTGVFVPVTELSAPRLSLLLHEVLTDSIYRDNAQRFQKIIAGHSGSAAAGDVLEEAFGLTSRTGRSIKPTAEPAEYSKIQ